MSFNPRNFRDALGCFPTGVAVVTTLGADGAPIGVTVSSFTSVSLTPPLVLFCLDKQNSGIDSFRAGRHFAVNVLGEDQKDLSVRFSRKAGNRWHDVSYDRWESGVPILGGCPANLECRSFAHHDGGDHVIFVGEVLRIAALHSGRPLVYHRGDYAQLRTD